jgi:hypothetical protein
VPASYFTPFILFAAVSLLGYSEGDLHWCPPGPLGIGQSVISGGWGVDLGTEGFFS